MARQIVVMLHLALPVEERKVVLAFIPTAPRVVEEVDQLAVDRPVRLRGDLALLPQVLNNLVDTRTVHGATFALHSPLSSLSRLE